MMKQSYTSFLNNVHKKANIHIFVIKVNESTGQRVNKIFLWGAQGQVGLMRRIGPVCLMRPACLIETLNFIHFYPITTLELKINEFSNYRFIFFGNDIHVVPKKMR